MRVRVLTEEKRDVHPDDYRLINAAMKPEARFFWKDVLACIEFKRPTKKLSQLPLAYEVELYKPTKPEYRCVESPVSDAPATAAASPVQAPARQPVPVPGPVCRSSRSSQNANNSNKRQAAETLQSASKCVHDGY